MGWGGEGEIVLEGSEEFNLLDGGLDLLESSEIALLLLILDVLAAEIVSAFVALHLVDHVCHHSASLLELPAQVHLIYLLLHLLEEVSAGQLAEVLLFLLLPLPLPPPRL